MNNFTRSNDAAGSAWNAPAHHEANEPRQAQQNNAAAMHTTYNFTHFNDPSSIAWTALAHHDANEFRQDQLDNAAAMHAGMMQDHDALMDLPAQYLDNAADINTNMSHGKSIVQ